MSCRALCVGGWWIDRSGHPIGGMPTRRVPLDLAENGHSLHQQDLQIALLKADIGLASEISYKGL